MTQSLNPELQFLSHYTSFEVLQKIVEGHTMWATDLFYMNDAAEFRYAIELIESMLDDFETVKPQAEKIIGFFSNKGESIGSAHSIYSISFSEKGDLLSQWRASSPKSGGVSIAFEKSALRALGSAGGCRLIKCIYKKDEQKEILLRISEKAKLSLYQGNSKSDVGMMMFNEILESAPQMKHLSFAEEHEWRLVTKPIGFDEDRIQYGIRKSMLIPYLPLCIMREGRLGFDHVRIGPNRNPDLAWSSTRRFLEGKLDPVSPVTVYKSETPFRSL